MISKLSLAALAAAMTISVAAAQPADRLTRLDANKDGAITVEEARAPRAALFARLDTDGDGVASAAELEAGKAKIEEAMADAPRGPRSGRGGRGGGGLARFDANGDGALTQEEFVNAALPVFERFDADKNGVLSAEEMQAIPSFARGG